MQARFILNSGAMQRMIAAILLIAAIGLPAYLVVAPHTIASETAMTVKR